MDQLGVRVRLLGFFGLPFVAVSSYAADAQTSLRGLVTYDPPSYRELDYSQRRESGVNIEQHLEAPSIPQGSEFKSSPSIYIKRIDVKGNTVFSDESMALLTSPYEKRNVSIDELHQLRQAISLKYFNAGYVNSGAIIPNQEVQDGTVTINVIEGTLESIQISGADSISEDYIRDRLANSQGEPLNVNILQADLRVLQASPLIKTVNADLSPSSEPGKADLHADVKEADFQSLVVKLDNYRSPSIGAEEIVATYEHINLSGYADNLVFSYAQSEGLSEAAVSYTRPLGLHHQLMGFYEYTGSKVVEAPFDQLDIESESNSFGAEYNYTFAPLSSEKWSLFAGFESASSVSTLLGQRFSFSSGAINGETSAAFVKVGGEFVERQADQIIYGMLSLRAGLDAFGANINASDLIPDSEFLAAVGQLQYAKRFAFYPGSQFLFRSSFQASQDPLLSLNKFALGGVSTVRGYRENQIAKDSGANASIEFKLPIFGDASGLQSVFFADWGSARDEKATGQTDEKVTIYSTGFGVEWRSQAGLSMDLYWGHALEDKVKSDDGDDLQDDGLHFAVSYRHGF